MRVLVIDDEPDVTEVRLTFNLRRPEAEVIAAGAGDHGWR